MLLDTNVLSELPRRRPNPKVVRWCSALEEVHLSVITLEELAFGIARAPLSARPRLQGWMEALLKSRPVVHPVTAEVARTSGELRAARESRGRRVAQADMLIAATALVHGLALATRHGSDFEGCGVALIDPWKA